jgi:hypothetical protein
VKNRNKTMRQAVRDLNGEWPDEEDGALLYYCHDLVEHSGVSGKPRVSYDSGSKMFTCGDADTSGFGFTIEDAYKCYRECKEIKAEISDAREEYDRAIADCTRFDKVWLFGMLGTIALVVVGVTIGAVI